MLIAPSPLLAASFTWLTWFGLEWFWKVCGLSPSSRFFSVCFGKSMNFRRTRLELSMGFQWWKKKLALVQRKNFSCIDTLVSLGDEIKGENWWDGGQCRVWTLGEGNLWMRLERVFFFLLYGRWPFWCGSKRVGQTAGTQRAHTVQSDHMVKFNQRPNAISIS